MSAIKYILSPLYFWLVDESTFGSIYLSLLSPSSHLYKKKTKDLNNAIRSMLSDNLKNFYPLFLASIYLENVIIQLFYETHYNLFADQHC